MPLVAANTSSQPSFLPTWLSPNSFVVGEERGDIPILHTHRVKFAQRTLRNKENRTMV